MQFARAFVRACALALGSGDEQVIAMDGQRAGIPVGGDETQSGNVPESAVGGFADSSIEPLLSTLEVSNTATAFSEASATNSRLPSAD